MSEKCRSPDDAILGGGLIILTTLLVLSMILGYLAKQRRISFLHEAGIATLLGMLYSGFL